MFIRSGALSALGLFAVLGQLVKGQQLLHSGFFNGHFYELYDTTANPLDWYQADSFATGLSHCEETGHLVQINNPSENNYVANRLFGNHHPSFGSGARIWLGLTDIGDDGNFVWTNDQSTPVYQNWVGGEPIDMPAEDCATLDSSGRWLDIPCTSAPADSGFVVEYDCVPAIAIGDWQILEGNPPIDISFAQERSNDEIIVRVQSPDPNLPLVSYQVEKFDFDTCSNPIDVNNDVLLVSEQYASPELEVSVDVVLEELASSSVFNAATNEVAFCMEINYFYNGVEATHLFVRFSFTLDTTDEFDMGVSNIQLETLEDLEDIGQTFQVNYYPRAFPCDENYNVIVHDTPFPQGTSVSFCLFALDGDSSSSSSDSMEYWSSEQVGVPSESGDSSSVNAIEESSDFSVPVDRNLDSTDAEAKSNSKVVSKANDVRQKHRKLPNSIFVSDILEVSLYQENGPTIDHALEDLFTSYECSLVHRGCRITIILDQRWYDPTNTQPDPLAVEIAGTITIGFADRMLQELGLDAPPQNPFATTVLVTREKQDSAANELTHDVLSRLLPATLFIFAAMML